MGGELAMACTDERENNEARSQEKRRFRVSYDQDKGEEIERYAKAKDLDVPAFLKFAARQYMDRYPQKSGKGLKAVHPDASTGEI